MRRALQVGLALTGGFAVVEAVRRLLAPAPVAGTTVMIVAAIGIVINVIVAWTLALVAGAVVHWTGWLPIHPLLTLQLSWPLVPQAGRVIPVVARQSDREQGRAE